MNKRELILAKVVFLQEVKDIAGDIIKKGAFESDRLTVSAAFDLLLDKIEAISNKTELEDVIFKCKKLSYEGWANSL